jgi:hypothetical protein
MSCSEGSHNLSHAPILHSLGDSGVGKLDNEDARVLAFRARRWLTSNRHVLISAPIQQILLDNK